MAETAFLVGASIWGFFHSRPPTLWPTLDGAVDSALSIDPSLGVEVWASRAVDEPAARGQSFDALARSCSRAGFVSVHVRGMFWYWNPEKLRREIDFVQSVGGRTLVIHPVCLGLKRPGDRIDVNEVRRIAEYAEARGVRLALENVRNSVWMLDHVLGVLGPDPEETNLGVCIDVGHAHLSTDAGSEPVSTYLTRYADSLIHLHLHDNNGARDEHLAIGEGTIDWSRSLVTLRAIGYSGTAVLEIHGSQASPVAAIERSVSVLRRLA